jgi:hypothetical protein
MTDAELRALVRDAVARHLGTTPRAAMPAATLLPAPVHQSSVWSEHPSHQIYLQVVNTTDACVIEPSVPCDHCGYCKSHGH